MTLQSKKTSSPIRSCVACQNRFSQEELLRLTLDSHHVIHLDYLGKCPGRGAYICPNYECFNKAKKTGNLSKSFRKDNISLDPVNIIKQANYSAEKQLQSVLSIANRAKKLSAGSSRAEFSLRHGKSFIVLTAMDASEGLKKKFSSWAHRTNIPHYHVLSKEKLARCVGSESCAILTVDQIGFAKAIEKEVLRSHSLQMI